MNSEYSRLALLKVGNPNVLINLISRRVRQLNSGGGAMSRPLILDTAGLGAADIALVRMPHAVGRLELWSFRDNALHKTLELGDVSNHVTGSRALRMSAVADFDGDGRPDLAIASFDRKRLRLIAFAPGIREIASIALPSQAVTDFALMTDGAGHPAVLLGLENGALVLARRP